MRTVDILDAQTQLPELVDLARCGESFVIARGGEPLVQVTSVNPALARKPRRRGFMPGIKVPEDFDTMMDDEIVQMFRVRD